MNQLPDGLYDRLMNGALQRSLEVLPPERQYEIEKLGSAELRRRLVLEIARLLPEIFDEISGSAGATESNREVDLINGLLAWIRQQGVEVAPLLTPARALRAVHPAGVAPIYPPTGLSAPWLFTAGRADPSLFAELRAELNSADRIDVLVSFITWSGLRKIIDVLESVTALNRLLKFDPMSTN